MPSPEGFLGSRSPAAGSPTPPTELNSMATISEIQQLYVAYFGRPADPAGLDYWVSTGITTKNFAAAMYAQPEFQQANASLSVSEQVNALYLNLFGRNADSEGLLYWTQQINTGKLTLASIANDLIYAANNSKAPQSLIDKTVLDNKTATAIAYTSEVRKASNSILAYNPTSTNPWVTGPELTSAVTYLATVTTTAPTAAATTAAVAAMTAIGLPGQTFTLTTSIDTATANTFNGALSIVGNFSLPTLNTGDALTGSGVNPTINATILVDGTTTTPALLSGIETLNATFSPLGVGAVGAATLNLQSGSSFNTITSANATQAVNFTGLQSALQNVTVSNTNQSQTFTFANAALAGASNALSLTLNGVTGGNINFNTITANVSGYETINLVSSGFAANTPGQINSGTNAVAYTTLNISGAAPITIAAGSTTAAVTTVNGGSATGAITYTVPGAASLAFTGGTGNDTIDMVATYTTADTINGGEGTDILAMNAAQAQATSNQTKVSSIENLRITSDAAGAATYAPALYGGATTLSLGATQNDGGGATTINAVAGTGRLDLRTFAIDGGGAVTVTMAGTDTADVYNLTYSGVAADIIGGNFNVNGVETLNITNSGTGAATIEGAVTITPSIGGARNLNILGSAQVILEGNNTFSIFSAANMTGGGVRMVNAAGTTTTVTQLAANITGSGFADRLGGSANSDVINGGAGADIINGNGGADLLTGGSSFDAFNFNAVGAGIAGNAGTLTSATSYTLISDLVVGTTAATSDLINIARGVTYTGTAGALTNADGTALAGGQDGAVNATSVAGGQVIVVADAVNFIKFTNAATTATGATADAAFDSVIGAGTITSQTATAQAAYILSTFYDAANSQAVVGYIISANTVISAADQFNVLSTVTMTAADYANFGANQINIAAAAAL